MTGGIGGGKKIGNLGGRHKSKAPSLELRTRIKQPAHLSRVHKVSKLLEISCVFDIGAFPRVKHA